MNVAPWRDSNIMTSFKAWPQVKPKLVKICLSASFSLENEVNKTICTGKYKLLISTGRR